MSRPIYKKRYSRSTVSLLTYLLFISVKHEIDVEQLIKGLKEAAKSKKCKCGELLIECRMKTDEYMMFRLTTGPKNIVQLRIPEAWLKGDTFTKILDSLDFSESKPTGDLKYKRRGFLEYVRRR